MTTEGSFQFLFPGDDGRLFRETRMWIVPDEKSGHSDAWSVSLDPPTTPDGAIAMEVDDLKAWLLDDKKYRTFYTNSKDIGYIAVERTRLLKEYFAAIRERLPERYRSTQTWVLMPAIQDQSAHDRYRRALEDAAPNASLLPEPEMIAEYFRLVQRTLTLKQGKNNLVLVIDIGAATYNMTFVLSRRDSAIVEASAGRQRARRLRSVRGDSNRHAGRWVDSEILRRLWGDPDSLSEATRTRLLREIEQAKIVTSCVETPTYVTHPVTKQSLSITTALLTNIADSLWEVLLHLFEDVAGLLLANLRGTDYAERTMMSWLDESDVRAPLDVPRLIDCILLAGGTSQLPGFETSMQRTLFGGGATPPILRVGDAYPIAAAAGALAHVLHQQYSPPRFHASDDDTDETFEADFLGDQSLSVLLGLKPQRAAEIRIPVLTPEDPFYVTGGRRPVSGLPHVDKGSRFRGRLIPGTEESKSDQGRVSRRGLPVRNLQVRRTPVKMDFEWDAVDQTARVYSEEMEGADQLFFDMAWARRKAEAVADTVNDDHPAGGLIVDGAPDIIIDFGMSKTVVVAADSGWVSAEWLEQRAVAPGSRGERRANTDTPPLRYRDSVLPSKKSEEGLPIDKKEVVPISARSAKVAAVPPAPAIVDADVKPTPLEAPAIPENGAFSRAATQAPRPISASREHFIADYLGLLEAARGSGIQLPEQDLTMLLLALVVRPFVLLAGPPGCGKSTLARIAAHVLGYLETERYYEVPVQAHWTRDSVLFGRSGLLAPLMGKEVEHLVLFDEFNLTRPEYYLNRFFYAMDGADRRLDATSRLAPCKAIGTLNIDDTSRAPSPKIVDRCFLLELDVAAPDAAADRLELDRIRSLPRMRGLPARPEPSSGTPMDPIPELLHLLNETVHKKGLRKDLLPSRRVVSDIVAISHLYQSTDMNNHSLLKTSELVDRIISGRILVKLSGAIEQVKPILDCVDSFLKERDDLRRSKSRLRLARQQSELGFVSPWQ